MTTLYGEISIVPLYLEICDDLSCDGYYVTNTAGLQLCFTANITCNNYSYSLAPRNASSTNLELLVNKMPIEPFIGKREGDNVIIKTKTKTFILTLAQKNCKVYPDSFEAILTKLLASYDNFYESTVYTPALSEEFKKAMFLCMHERYTRSIRC